MESEKNNRAGFVALILMRVIYAINWLNIGSVFKEIAFDFNSNVSALGSMTSTFYLGIGIFQVPGGIFAAKYGAKKTVILGNFISSLGALLCSFARDVNHLLILRFIVGAGMAFVFSPGVSIVASYFGKNRKGYSVGLYNSAYDIGGFFALFFWGVLAASIGWRPSLAFSGILGIISTIFGQLLVKTHDNSYSGVNFDEMKKIFFDKQLFYLSIGVLAVGTGNAFLGSFLIYYLEKNSGYSEILAGSIASVVVLVPVFSSIIGGRFYDSTKNAKILIFISGVLMSLGVGIVPVGGGITSLIGVVLGGIAVGFGITVGFAAAREMSKASYEYEPLAVGWVNFISLFGVFIPPIIFSRIAEISGYNYAWLFGSVITLALSIPVLRMKS
jgi:MFS family permease